MKNCLMYSFGLCYNSASEYIKIILMGGILYANFFCNNEYECFFYWE